MAMASQFVANMHQELSDITVCTICMESFKDPRILPCVHTFCLGCLEAIGDKSKRQQGTTLPCPMCRSEFPIPPNGFIGLKKNFVIGKILEMKKMLNPRKIFCGPCSNEFKVAELYCTDCHENLCRECCDIHKKLKILRTHRLFAINTQDSGDENATDNTIPEFCKSHDKKSLEIYCIECEAIMCVTCFFENHKGHTGSDIVKIVEKFRHQLSSNNTLISTMTVHAEMKKMELQKVLEDLDKKKDALMNQIEERKNDLKTVIDQHADLMLQQLLAKTQENLKHAKADIDSVESFLCSLESHNLLCKNMMIKGSASDVCRTSSSLSARVIELQRQSEAVDELKPHTFQLLFIKSKFDGVLLGHSINFIGLIGEQNELEAQDGCKEVMVIDRQEMDKEKTSKSTLELELTNLKTELQEEKMARSAAQAEITKLKELQEEKAAKNATETEVASLKKELQEEKAAKNATETEVASLKKELQDEKAAKNATETEVASLKKELQEEKAAKNATETEVASLKNELQDEKAAKNATETEVASLETELLEEKVAKNAIAAEVINLEKVVQEEKVAKNATETEVASLEKELQDEKVAKNAVEAEVINLKNEEFKAEASDVARRVSTKEPIFGLAMVDAELFVLCRRSSEILVYNSGTFEFHHKLSPEGLFDPGDIVSCNRYNSLYILNAKREPEPKQILRIDRKGSLEKCWSVQDWGRLSVTEESHVILTIYATHKICEYSSEGCYLRDIMLSGAGLFHPWHAIKLQNGNFIVSHGFDDQVQRVSIIDTNGKPTSSNQEQYVLPKKWSNVQDFNRPFYLSVDSKGCVYVADLKNKRILVLDQDLKLKKQITSDCLQCPYRILLDENNDRLFVADNKWDSANRLWKNGCILDINLL